MSVRAKFYCAEKLLSATQGETANISTKIVLRPVYGDNPENKEFFKWTPCGEINISVVNEAVADRFVLGKTYYVDFTPAE